MKHLENLVQNLFPAIHRDDGRSTIIHRKRDQYWGYIRSDFGYGEDNNNEVRLYGIDFNNEVGVKVIYRVQNAINRFNLLDSYFFPPLYSKVKTTVFVVDGMSSLEVNDLKIWKIG